MTIILDGTCMTSREALHDHLTERLQLPDYYGRNLDALFDLLTQIGSETAISLIHQKTMLEALGRYGEGFLETLQQAAQENPNLTFSAQ